MRKRNEFERGGREGDRADRGGADRRSRDGRPTGGFSRGETNRPRDEWRNKTDRFEARPEREARGDRAAKGTEKDRDAPRFSRDRDAGRDGGYSSPRRRHDSDRPFEERTRGVRGEERRPPREASTGERGNRQRDEAPSARRRPFKEEEREFGRRADGNDFRRFDRGDERPFGKSERNPRGERDGDKRFDREERGGRSFSDNRRTSRDERDGDRRFDREERGSRSFSDKRAPGAERGGDRRFDREERGSRSFSDKRAPGAERGGDRRFDREERGSRSFSDKRAPGAERGGERRFEREGRKFDDRSFSGSRRDSGSRDFEPGRRGDRPAANSGSDFSDKPRRGFREDERGQKSDFRKPRDSDRGGAPYERRDRGDAPRGRYDGNRAVNRAPKNEPDDKDGEIRLNRFIANAGICSRREADELIESGQITVNGKVVSEMGFKVKSSDIVKYGKRVLNAEKLVYILLNKPKDFITTTDDPEDRRTVLDLIKGACEERVYPVGRLDRNTTGLLLITNDGELAEKLTHPSHNTKKIYQAELDKPITLEDFEALKKGVELEDGFIKPDDIGIVTPDAYVVGIEVHSGRNRIVRRMFEHFGYEVKKLDRTTFAGLNKKDLPRGNWRFLTQKEVISLKFLS